jgi:ATP-dependent helicase YprA (DUF1998 family)
MGYVLRHAATLFCMSDIRDINTDSSLYEAEPGTWRSALYLYDAIEGGVGYAERIFESIDKALQFCAEMLDNCKCEQGCPSCIPPLPPGVDSAELEAFMVESNAARECTKSLIDSMLGKGIRIPEVRVIRNPIAKEPIPVPDIEGARRIKKLGRAAKILNERRERLH